MQGRTRRCTGTVRAYRGCEFHCAGWVRSGNNRLHLLPTDLRGLGRNRWLSAMQDRSYLFVRTDNFRIGYVLFHFFLQNLRNRFSEILKRVKKYGAGPVDGAGEILAAEGEELGLELCCKPMLFWWLAWCEDLGRGEGSFGRRSEIDQVEGLSRRRRVKLDFNTLAFPLIALLAFPLIVLKTFQPD